tara:strand:- start:581 stop:817 length:237 start_codon:yes stop_codon:yes gene_type:complete
MKTYYNELDLNSKDIVLWMDILNSNPKEIDKLTNMTMYFIDSLSLRDYPAFHDNKKIDKWIINKMKKVVKTYKRRCRR